MPSAMPRRPPPFRLLAAAAAVLALAGCTRGPHDVSLAANAEVPAEVGAPAPALRAFAHDGSLVDLAELRGRTVILYFYPKDETPGCTKEACAFRDAWQRFQARGVVLIGVSADSAESHRAFAKHHALPFRLVSDGDGRIAEAFRVPHVFGFTGRQTFVIGPDGRITHVHRSVDPLTHAAELEAEVP